LGRNAVVRQAILAAGELCASKGDENPRLGVAECRPHLIGIRAGLFDLIGRVFDRAGGLCSPMPHIFPAAGFRITWWGGPQGGPQGRTPGRTPWSARDALVPSVLEESVGCHHREADQGVGRGRGRPPHCLCNYPETGKASGLRLQPARRPERPPAGKIACHTRQRRSACDTSDSRPTLREP
jgi:hypothetical protein